MCNNMPTTNPSNNQTSVKWTDLSDAELISKYSEGAQYAAAVLCTRYFKKLRCLATSIVKDSDLAADVVNDVLERVLSKIRQGEYSESGTFKAYVMCSVANKAKDYFRTAHSKKEAATDFDDAASASLGKILDDDEALDLAVVKEERLVFIEKAMESLPCDLRDVLSLRLKGIAYKDIAEQFGISINTATSRYKYAVDRLKKMARGL